MAAASRLREKQQDMEYREALRQQDIAIDLQMNERAKMWEIQKMELRSQIDFQREEKSRQRKLDSIDSAMQQIDKEVLAGRITEQEAYPIKQKLELSKLGINVPTSAFPGDEKESYGVKPYWMEGYDAAEGTPERQLYDAKMAEQISGERRGTIPYYLDPTYIKANPSAARQAQEARGIFLSDEEFNDLTRTTPEAPLGGKSLDIGVQAEQPELKFMGYGKDREEVQAGEQTLDAATARQILAEAGGDKDKARQIARQRGFSF